MTLHALTSSDVHAVSGPVVVLLHGYGSNERDLVGLMPFLPEGLPWVSLRAPLALGAEGAAWFPIVRPGDPDPEPVAEATDAVWSWIDEHLPAGTPVVALGFSQGGMMATQLLRTRPERVAATVVLGGFVQSASQPADGELALRRPPVFWGRGADDRVIAPVAIERTLSWLPEHATVTQHVYPQLGHSISQAELEDVSAFLAPVLAAAVPR